MVSEWSSGLSALDLESPHVANEKVANIRDVSVWSAVSLSSLFKKTHKLQVPHLIILVLIAQLLPALQG